LETLAFIIPPLSLVLYLANLNVALDSKSQSTTSSTTNEGQRFPFTGTIDQIGNDVMRINR
jgi:hypothetical protein